MVSTHDDDSDPTGMRALLRGLPDPGPMPDDLVERIQSSLTDLAAGDAGAGGDTVRDGDTSGVSRGTEHDGPAPRASWWVRNGSRAAVAAVVLVGGGAVASDQLGLLGSGSDSASTAGSIAETSSDAGSGGRALTPSGGDADKAPQSGGDSAETDGGSAPAGQVVVTMSGRSYTAAGLAAEVGSATTSTPTSPLTAESPGIGPIGTEIGVRSCLLALGLPRDSAARVDLALVDGAPAAVLVLTTDRGRTAYAVGRDCTLGNPAVLAGPVDLP